MEAKPPLRERSWYAVVWWVLLIVSGPWTLFNAYMGSQLVLHQAHNIDQGFAVIGWEAFLVVSIPIYCLFVALLFSFPKRSSKGR
jgi:hypothetical protein